MGGKKTGSCVPKWRGLQMDYLCSDSWMENMTPDVEDFCWMEARKVNSLLLLNSSTTLSVMCAGAWTALPTSEGNEENHELAWSPFIGDAPSASAALAKSVCNIVSRLITRGAIQSNTFTLWKYFFYKHLWQFCLTGSWKGKIWRSQDFFFFSFRCDSELRSVSFQQKLI